MIDLSSFSTMVYLFLLGIGGFLVLYKVKIMMFPNFKATIVSFPDLSEKACNSCRTLNKGRMSIPLVVKKKDGENMEAEASICEVCLNKITVGSLVGVSKIGSRFIIQPTFNLKEVPKTRIKRNPKRLIGAMIVIGLLLTVLLMSIFSSAQSIEVQELDLSKVGKDNKVEADTALRTTSDYVVITFEVFNPYGQGNVTIKLYNNHFYDKTVEFEDEGSNEWTTKLTREKESTIFDPTNMEYQLVTFKNITLAENTTTPVTLNWTLENEEGAHFLFFEIVPDQDSFVPLNGTTVVPTIAYNTSYVGILVYGEFNEDTNILNFVLSPKFIIGFVALFLFFAMILLSLLGVIPQDRLPVQAALILTAFVIVILAFIGHAIDNDVLIISALDLDGMIIIHPITALVAGFLVAGALEAAGAFEAAADALNRMEGAKIGNWEILGISGTIVILVNIPTIISMPCGRILGAALMPAALYFGYKVARKTEDLRIVGVVVFGFIVNAAASCGPSPLGGIGTIGEGLSRMNIGTFSDAQQIGIMMCTGVCMVILRFVTPLIPSDLKEELEEKMEKKNGGGES